MDNNRKTAYNTLIEIEKNGAYSNIELNRQIKSLNPDSPGFVRELVYGVLENKIYIDYILSSLIPKGLKGVKKQDLTILRMGLYQIAFMNSVPLYAAVNESVILAKKYCHGRAGFINGVLRGYDRNKDEIRFPSENNIVNYLSVKYSYSKWIVNLWLNQFGREKTEDILKAGNLSPLISIRVNLCKTTKSSLIKQLKELEFSVTESTLCDNVLLVRGSGLLDTNMYKMGLFSVQDEASAYAINILGPVSGSVVLDICAAPGGKTLAMAELMNNTGEIYAFDVYKHKLELLEKESQRLGLNIIKTCENDGLIYNKDYEEMADYVLVDGPCSGLGVIRKKPEIKYKNIDDEGKSLSDKQLEILSVSSRYVKPGGTILYSTCTINKFENEDVVERFLKKNKNFEVIFQKQLLPNIDLTDGFFICKMRKL